MRTKKVLIVENHAIVRQGLRTLLDRSADLEVVGEAADGRDALRLLRLSRTDIVLLDIRMPNLNGVDACRQITKEYPTVKVIALTLVTEQDTIRRMFEAGAKGYLLKDGGLDQLLHAIRTVLSGKTYLTPELQKTAVGQYDFPSGDSHKRGKPLLSGREREVLQLVAEGRTTRQIAEMLDISVKTVETHRHNLMQKTGLFSIADLTKFAIRTGLTSVGFDSRNDDRLSPLPQ